MLLAFDGSPSAATAIAVAGRLLEERHAVVCHVRHGGTRDQVAAGVELAGEAGFGVEAMPEREHRKAWRALLEAAADVDAALVVAGAHGHSGIGRAILGSVSTGLVHHARLPVLIVPAATAEEPCDGPSLLCYDGSA